MEESQEQTRKQLLDDWFDNKFLSIYQNPQRVEHARRLLHRYQPDDKTLDNIIQFILADNRRRKVARDRKEFYPPAPNCYTFFNESRWMDKIKETAIVEEKEEIEKQKCPDCQKEGKMNFEFPHMDNKQHLCSWHFSKKWYNDGPTGLNKLREAHKNRIPKEPNESFYDYIKRTLKQKRTLEPDTRERPKAGLTFTDLENAQDWS
jgi:DNA-binding transcriptional regulator GbsR (MarR family)